MDSEILIFGAMNLVGGALALFLAHAYYLPKMETSTIEPALYEVSQRETLPVEPFRP
jgi:hypothetical protein